MLAVTPEATVTCISRVSQRARAMTTSAQANDAPAWVADGVLGVSGPRRRTELRDRRRFGDRRSADNGLVVTAAHPWTCLDDRLMLDAIGNVRGTQGALVHAERHVDGPPRTA